MQAKSLDVREGVSTPTPKDPSDVPALEGGDINSGISTPLINSHQGDAEDDPHSLMFDAEEWANLHNQVDEIQAEAARFGKSAFSRERKTEKESGPLVRGVLALGEKFQRPDGSIDFDALNRLLDERGVKKAHGNTNNPWSRLVGSFREHGITGAMVNKLAMVSWAAHHRGIRADRILEEFQREEKVGDKGVPTRGLARFIAIYKAENKRLTKEKCERGLEADASPVQINEVGAPGNTNATTGEHETPMLIRSVGELLRDITARAPLPISIRGEIIVLTSVNFDVESSMLVADTEPKEDDPAGARGRHSRLNAGPDAQPKAATGANTVDPTRTNAKDSGLPVAGEAAPEQAPNHPARVVRRQVTSHHEDGSHDATASSHHPKPPDAMLLPHRLNPTEQDDEFMKRAWCAGTRASVIAEEMIKRTGREWDENSVVLRMYQLGLTKNDVSHKRRSARP